jgi:hypothetical protein
MKILGSMTPRHRRESIQLPRVALSAVVLVFLTLICAAPDVNAGAANGASKTTFEAIGTVQPSRRGCGTAGCPPNAHCECVEYDGPGQAQVSGLGTIKEVNVAFLINIDACVQSPSDSFKCCAANGVLQFFHEPGPVAFNFDLSNGTICEGPNETSYKAAFQPMTGMAGSTATNSKTVPTTGEFVGIPVGTDGHILFFMK